MAKKVRTPPPPKKVQVPQQRRDARRGGTGGPARPTWVYLAVGAVAAALVAAAILGVVLLRDDGGGTKTTTSSTNFNNLPGVRKTKAPWPVDYTNLADRLAPLGLTTLPGHEGLVRHDHAHLDIFVNGKRVPVPALIGINPGAGYLTELHTHDNRGVIHIEAQKEEDFSLGKFFAEWGVFLNKNCVGGYCGDVKWYVDGKQQTGNPADLVLEPHQQISVVVGKPPAKIPSSYSFSPGE